MRLGVWTLPEAGLFCRAGQKGEGWQSSGQYRRDVHSGTRWRSAFRLVGQANSRRKGISRPARCTRENHVLRASASSHSIPAWQPISGRPARLWSRKSRRFSSRTHSSLQEEVLLPLGLDFLTFLAATVIVIPVFKSVKASPVLGFLFSGLILGQLG